MVSSDRLDIQPPFQPAFEHADRLVVEHFGTRLQASYLAGSLASGEAWPGASDFDGFVFTADPVTPSDLEWRTQTEELLGKSYPVVSVFHLNLYPIQRLKTESFWRFILRYNATRFRGKDILTHLAADGYPSPEPTPAFARERLPFVVRCIEAACRGDCPPALEKRLADPLLWTRKLVRNFIVVEGAFFLMANGRFRSFRQDEVLGGLETTFPQWSSLYAKSRAVLNNPCVAGLQPEDFMREARPFLQWMVQTIG